MKTAQTVIHFQVDTTPCETIHENLTGEQIKALARKPPANTLYVIEHQHGQPYRREIGDTESVTLHDGEHFVTEPPVGKTS